MSVVIHPIGTPRNHRNPVNDAISYWDSNGIKPLVQPHAQLISAFYWPYLPNLYAVFQVRTT